jgi:hypothetical protein
VPLCRDVERSRRDRVVCKDITGRRILMPMRLHFFAELQGKGGTATRLSFCERSDVLPQAIHHKEIDGVLVGCETGFSEFGNFNEFLADSFGVDYEFMREKAEWNRYENLNVSLLGFSNSATATDSNLRALALLPYGGSQPGRGCLSYRRFEGRRPSRDFYYNVAYAAFEIVCGRFGAKRLWVMNPAAPWSFHEDIASCICEALAHWCDGNPQNAPSSVVFQANRASATDGSGMHFEHFRGAEALNAEGANSRHRPIKVQRDTVRDTLGNSVEVVNLDWWS